MSSSLVVSPPAGPHSLSRSLHQSRLLRALVSRSCVSADASFRDLRAFARVWLHQCSGGHGESKIAVTADGVIVRCHRCLIVFEIKITKLYEHERVSTFVCVQNSTKMPNSVLEKIVGESKSVICQRKLINVFIIPAVIIAKRHS